MAAPSLQFSDQGLNPAPAALGAQNLLATGPWVSWGSIYQENQTPQNQYSKLKLIKVQWTKYIILPEMKCYSLREWDSDCRVLAMSLLNGRSVLAASPTAVVPIPATSTLFPLPPCGFLWPSIEYTTHPALLLTDLIGKKFCNFVPDAKNTL